MRITVNDETRTLDDGASVADLVAAFGLEPLRVAVEVNAQLVRRATFAKTALRDGDRIEIVALVGGG